MSWFNTLDPRTIFFVFPLALTSMFVLSGEMIRDFCFIIFLFAVLVLLKRTSFAIKWSLFLFLIHLPLFLLSDPPKQIDLVAFSMRKVCMIFSTGAIMLSAISTSHCINLMKKMKIHRNLIIPITICFRFLPTLGTEAAIIRDALRIRGIYSLKHLFIRPLSTGEIFLAAFIFRVHALGEELVYSLSTRGLNLKGNSFYRDIGFTSRDFAFAAGTTCYIIFILYSPLLEINL